MTPRERASRTRTERTLVMLNQALNRCSSSPYLQEKMLKASRRAKQQMENLKRKYTGQQLNLI